MLNKTFAIHGMTLLLTITQWTSGEKKTLLAVFSALSTSIWNI